ncbi:hypothetical protein ACKLTP_18375 [Paenarthrobacter ureafaciens]|jgi:hypothetical protein|uniref:hypothetical protein n=1 Tax=Paenarthrobacter TaxID=1742992 RepID=UPI00222F0443|nr:hypothetical protein [Paenarthrobacter sp. PAE-2]MCW3768836.1 hypothetical protein [Paenarthrobacter sp. PAE-2]
MKFLPEAPCGKLRSIAGTAAGQAIVWVSDGQITVQLDRVDRNPYLTVVLPCGPVNVPVTISGSDMVVSGKIAVGASGCADAEKGERQLWALGLLQNGVRLDFSRGVMTWTNGEDSLSFDAI